MLGRLPLCMPPLFSRLRYEFVNFIAIWLTLLYLNSSLNSFLHFMLTDMGLFREVLGRIRAPSCNIVLKSAGSTFFFFLLLGERHSSPPGPGGDLEERVPGGLFPCLGLRSRRGMVFP
jgi:hypothetical protein